MQRKRRDILTRISWSSMFALLTFTAGCASLTTPSTVAEIGWRTPTASSSSRPLLAVALGSGAQRGYAHIGVIRAFEKAGIRPDIIVGTSIGAIIGCLWASGLSADEIENAVGQMGWGSMSDWRFPITQLFKGSVKGLFSGEELAAFVRRHVGFRRIEDLPLTFATVVADLQTGERLVVNRGDLATAVRASANMPVAFTPMSIDFGGTRRELVDGGIVEPVPIESARMLGAGFIVAVDVSYRPAEARLATLIDVTFQSFQIAANALRNEQLARADLVIQPYIHESMINDGNRSAVMQNGEMAANEALIRMLERWPGARAGTR